MLQLVKKILIAVTALCLICGCEKFNLLGMIVPTGDTVDARVEQSLSMTGGNSVERFEVSGQYKFYVFTDAHLEEETGNVREFVRRLRNDADASFGVNLGDCIEIKDNFPLYLEAISFSESNHLYNYPIFNVLGNHDVYFNAWEDYKRLLGPSMYWFEVKCDSACDLFLVLDSATATLGRRQNEWLREFLKANRDDYRYCFVMTHTNLLYDDLSQLATGNMPLEETMALIDLFSEYEVNVVLQGHDHHRGDLSIDGVRYTVVGTLVETSPSPEYLCISVSDSSILYDWHIL